MKNKNNHYGFHYMRFTSLLDNTIVLWAVQSLVDVAYVKINFKCNNETKELVFFL